MFTTFRNTLAIALLALVFGFLGAAIWSYAGLADGRTRDFLLANPKIMLDVNEELQKELMSERLADIGDDLYEPFPGAVMGNPDGSKVLIEFSDYNCGYCKRSLADVDRLIAADPDLKVIIREWPIFEGSDGPARMALAAAKQGKYAAFHKAMFDIGGSSDANIEAAAKRAGLDLEKAKADAVSDDVTVEIATNLSLAQQLGFNGTPAWVTWDQALGGAVGFDALKEAIDSAGTSRPDASEDS